MLLIGCGSKKNNNVASDETREELKVCEDDKMCFILNGKQIKVEDDLKSATSITDLKWINDKSVAIICHVNPSLDYFIVYDVENDNFSYKTYGVEFVWTDEDVTALVYIEIPAHSAKTSDPYRIVDYSGKELLSSIEAISDLELNDGELTYQITSKNNDIKKEKIFIK